ncbi:MAG: bifunctional 4-hydroxy-2-oxoglutarate aldolase/2-dehydro-3-deoxy-phosphogluconate aldolase [Opitutales bacterium]|nr:bifunctional 4-hydroxy-2-oxoglutarate aldolase/2-dehydro-3-deoxy-phosphogluconate aldolase [Opitutales bacterium]
MNGFERIALQPILPVIVIDDADSALPLAEALLAGGLSSIEITFRTAAAPEAIRRIRDALPEMHVGAGTILRVEQAKAALDAGAQFALSPGLNEKVVRYFAERKVPFIPGIMTPTEIDRATELGCTFLKFFPAENAGGAAALKGMNAPFKHLKLKFCPTGGLTLANMGDYLSMPEVFAIGGSWLAKREQITGGKWGEISQQAKEALQTAAKFRAR